MRISVTATISFVVIIFIFALVYSIAGYQAMPEWVLQFTFYAFMTAVFGFIFGIFLLLVRDYLRERKIEKIEKMKSLQSLKKEYERCAWSIENSIEKNVEKNKKASLKAGLQDSWIVGDAKISEELRIQVQEFNEKCKEYNMFRKISEPYIINTIEIEVKRMFPKTIKKSDGVQTMLCSDFLMARYFNGENVTTNWFRETHPRALQNITKEIDKSERGDLDVFFNDVNNRFQKNEVLLRFRKEKKGLIEHSKETIRNFQTEINSLNEKLKRYSNLRFETLESSSEDELYE